MITVFTLCSANYLAHAKTLGDSLAEHNPEFRFVIGLVDRLPAGLPTSLREPFEIIPVEELKIPGFWEMVEKYDLVELSTALKPFFIAHLYRSDPPVGAVIYLDPDILVYGSLGGVTEKLQTHNIVVTPHSCTFDDSPTNIYYETGMLTTGVYNLGFIATSRSKTTFAFLEWWQKRVRANCYYDPGSGLFVDQLWVTLAPLYFPGVFVEKDPGYNMCYWNHFERTLSRENGRYMVNNKHELIFYHFSSYDPRKPDAVTSRTKSQPVSFAERPDLKLIYEDYRARLLEAGYAAARSLPWRLPRTPSKGPLTWKNIGKRAARTLVRVAPDGGRVFLINGARFVINCLK